ncbi:hypothetical protein [Lutispora thermophila]|uniref:WYL domain-containing protein n=1 Tax=Lutispora thermophila DSM 19022 TaxID=1122184 RepID=A0A1M6GUU0_9FIRM|nr:hypothetical protein [Lutispora thermophila]SHJ13723.1 hypothetical protein SAMN02745176_02523 [Lutispora thermophila DSM 19022]
MIEHILKASLERGRVITIIYNGESGISGRNIKVLEFKGDKVKAYCYLRKQIRYFKIENILSAEYCYFKRKAV